MKPALSLVLDAILMLCKLGRHNYQHKGYSMPFGQTENINQLWAGVLVEELLRQHVIQFYISPGSRSTPLTIAVARNPGAKSHICYDERQAAFMALGYARATNKPAVLICTSGTAAANYYPAVIEAASEQLPLIVLSADRPPELRATGANQTIDQQHLFGGYPVFFMDLPAPDVNVPLRYLLSTVDQAVFNTLGPRAGVAHLNCMFREPLAPKKQQIPDGYLQEIYDWSLSDEPFTRIVSGQPAPRSNQFKDLQQNIRNKRVGMLIVGRLKNEEERIAVREIAGKLKCPVFADISSGLRLDSTLQNLIPHFDLLLLSNKLKNKFAGMTVLHLGGKYVSKRLMQFLEKHDGRQIQIHDNRQRLDPGLSMDIRVECSLPDFNSILGSHDDNHPVLDFIKQADNDVAQLIKTFSEEEKELNELAITRSLSDLLSADTGLFLSSSMPVRDMDMYGLPGSKDIVHIAANRGASGIDGVISSSLGYSHGLQKAVTLLIGDIAFLHDLSALQFINAHVQPLTIVLVNNGGGGIFSFLPVSEYSEVFETFFATPHKWTFADTARQFNLAYFQPQSITDFEHDYRQVQTGGKPALIELITDRQANTRSQRALQKSIKSFLDKQ